MTRPAIKAILKEKELWGLVGMWLIYCYRPIFLNETFFFRDLCYISFPKRKHLLELLMSGQLPLWDPYLHGGHPFLAAIVNAVCYPTTILYLFLPLVKAFNVAIVLDFLGCSLFAYFCGRILGLRRVSSLIVGVIYGCCGNILSLGDQLRFFGMTQVPLLLAAWHLFLTERKRRWFALTIFAGMAQVLRGAPEVNVISMLFLLGWSCVFPFPATIVKRIFFWLILGASILGISAFQIVPTIEAITQSSRGGEGVQYGIFTQWSLHPLVLPELLFPQFRGYTDILPYNVNFWGSDIGDKGYPYFLSLYFGGVTLALAIIGIVGGKNDPRLPAKARGFLLASILLAFFLAFGRYLPTFEWLYHTIPLIRLFRYPIKFLLAAIFPIALLAGYGAEWLFSETLRASDKSGASRLSIALCGITALLGSVMLAFWQIEPFANAIQQFFFNKTGEMIHQGVTNSLTHAFFIWLAFTLICHAAIPQKKRWHQWALAGIVMLDLLVAGKHVNPVAPAAFFTDEPPIVALVREHIGDGRLYRTEDPLPQMFYITPDEKFPVPPDHIAWLYRWQTEVLRMYVAALYNIPVIFHDDYDLFAQLRIVKLKALLDSLPWERRLPLLSASGVSVIVSAEHLQITGVQKIATIPNLSEMPVHLYKLMDTTPQVRMAPFWKMVATDDEALFWLLKPDYDPRQHVVLQTPEPDVFALPWTRKLQASQEINNEPSNCAQPLQATVSQIEKKNNSMSYQVSSNCAGYLVFSEPYYPGWHVKIDGKPRPILRANYAFSAVLLDAGTHTVVRYYLPDSLLIGIVISVLTAMVLSAAVFTSKNSFS